MTAALKVIQIGPAAGFQDLGRPGYIASGLTRGGAIDTLAVYEGAALLKQSPDCAVLEIASVGGVFEATAPLRIALTGADMTARIDDATAAWNAVHQMEAGQRLTIGAARSGSYAYLHIGGGFDAPVRMGARGGHMSAGLGKLIAKGDTLPALPDTGTRTGYYLPRDKRFDGGTVRIVPSVQTNHFPPEERARFEATAFKRDPRANRQGIRMEHDGEGFAAQGMRTIVSEVIVQGDIQITGDGTPFVLMCESQTTGGYPRIGTVIPADLPRMAQTPAGGQITFQFITLDEAVAIQQQDAKARAGLAAKAQPLVRDINDISDLLSYQLVSGAISAQADPFE
tara:strand:+ start:86019 stop:87038 length:1020 start_codon:yes stop_codon:yes gene_type:complete